MESMGYIYKITNNINSKVYIGQTSRTILQRWREHCRGSVTEIDRAIQEFGKDNFTIETVERIPISQLDKREIYWIDFYDSYHSGYNNTLGGKDATRCLRHILIVEEGLKFLSLTICGQVLSQFLDLSASTIRERILRVLDKDELLWGCHFVSFYQTPIDGFSSLQKIEEWAKGIEIVHIGKVVYCPELQQEFSTITSAADYILNNNLYYGKSLTPKQTIITSIGSVLKGRTSSIQTRAGKLTFNYVNGKTTLASNSRKQDKKSEIYCPELDVRFPSQVEMAEYLLTNNIWKGIGLKTAKLRISDVVRGAFPHYKGLTFKRL